MVVTRNLSPLITHMDRKRNDRGLLYRVLAIYTHMVVGIGRGYIHINAAIVSDSIVVFIYNHLIC